MEQDILYLACTRGPKSVGGLPVAGWWVNILYPYLGYMTIGQADLLHFQGYNWILQGVVIYFGMRWLVEWDPNIFRIIQTAFDCGINRVHWAAPCRLPRSSRKMTSAL